MPPRVQQGAARMQHDPQPSPSGLEWDWNDVRVFLACVKLGSFRKAADQLGFAQHHPSLLVDLRCAMESADVLRMEANLAVQFVRPSAPELIVTKLGRLHVYPFASRSYVDRY